MEKKYLSPREINKLKSELMSTKTRSNNKPKSFCFKSNISRQSYSQLSRQDNSFDQYYKYRNDEIAEDFEENIRQILAIDFQWKPADLDRKFSYRKITVKDEKDTTYIIKTNDTLKLKIKNNEILLKLNHDNSLDILEKDEFEKLNDQNEKIIKKYEIDIIVGSLIEVEIDGLFQIDDFSISNFSSDEISTIYNNVEDIKNFKNAAIEVKYGPKNLGDLVAQLKRDKEVLDELNYNSDNKYVFIGFIKSKLHKIDKKVFDKAKKELQNINCIIFGLNGPIFNKRKINKFYDWNKIINDEKRFKLLEERIDNRIKEMENRIWKKVNKKINKLSKKIRRELNDNYSNLNKKLDLLLNQESCGNIRNKKYLGKKKKR